MPAVHVRTRVSNVYALPSRKLQQPKATPNAWGDYHCVKLSSFGLEILRHDELGANGARAQAQKPLDWALVDTEVVTLCDFFLRTFKIL